MEFKTHVTTDIEAKINSYNIACIIKGERQRLLGDKDRYIRNGVVYESDYRFNGSEEIRKATDDEIKLYEAMLLLEKHFRSLS